MFLVLSLLILSSVPADTLDREKLREKLGQGQEAIYSLDFDGADRIAREIISSNPEDPHGYALKTFVTWNRLLNAAGNLALDDYATPNPLTERKTQKPINAETKAFHQANDRLVEICDKLLENNPNNPEALYFKGVAYENLTAESIAITKSLSETFANERRVRSLHQKVLEVDPRFVDAKLSLGTSEFAAATLHWSLRWLAFLIGRRGNKAEALAKIEEVRRNGAYRSLDASTVLALLNAWKGDPNQAVAIFSQLGARFPRNYLIDINIAALYELVLNQPRRALEVYSKLADSLPGKAAGLKEGEVVYRMGRTHYRLREYSLALRDFDRALKAPRGELETEAMCHYYIAKIHEEQGDKSKAVEHYRKMLEYKGGDLALQKELKEAKRKAK